MNLKLWTVAALLLATLTVKAQTATRKAKAKKATSTRVKSTGSKAGIAAPANGKYIDPANMDLSVSPGDNFYIYANGAWLKNTPIPSTETRWGSFNILNEKTQELIKQILEDCARTSGPKGSSEQMVGDFFASGMDEAAIEALGLRPIAPFLADIDNVQNFDGLISLLAKRQRQGLGGVFGIYVGVDDKDVNTNILNIFQGGLGLPDRDYYTKKDERSEKIRAGYREMLGNMFTLLGDQKVDQKVAAVYALEEAMAQASMSRVEMRDPYKLYNKMEIPELSRKSVTIDFVDFIKQLGVKSGAKEIIVAQPEFIAAVSKLLKNKPLEDWKAYLRVHTLIDMAPYLNKAADQTRFNFYGKILRGQKEQKPRWKRVASVVDGAVGMETGKIYVKKYFTPEAKERMLELVNNLQDVYRERIQNLTWMSSETKSKALEKLNSFMKKIAFPDKWRVYEGLEVTRNNYVQNIINSNICDYEYNMGKLGKPVDRTEWGMTPPTINAYYNPSYNEIVFPAGILQFPFFDFGADDAVNYGGIGAVIGHEMTHGFDDQGAQYAADGNLRDWWTEEDKKRFKEKTDAIVRQYNNYVVLDTMHVNGELTQGENIADLGGVTIAYEAFTRTKQFKEGKKIDGFTPQQRFFLSWAQIWRSNSTEEETAQRIATDPHSPGEHRCNGPLSNFMPFYKAFNVTPKNKMYVDPAQHLIVW